MSRAYQPPDPEIAHWGAGWASAPMALESHRPLPMNDVDLVLHVVRGYVDLFALRETAAGEPSRRRHLFRVEQGAVAFGLPGISDTCGNSIAVIAVGGLETEVVIDHRGRFVDRDGIDAWATQVSRIIAASPEGAVVQQATIGSRHALATGDILRLSGRRVAWIGIQHGTIGVMEMPGAHGSGEVPLPIPPGAWIVAREDATLAVRGEPVLQDRRGRSRGGRPPAPALESQPVADQQHRRPSCRHHRCRARIITVRRGWRQPSAGRLSGGRRRDGRFARSAGQRAVRQR